MWFSDKVWKNGECIKYIYYLMIVENKDFMLGCVMIFIFNRFKLMNDNVKLKLLYFLDVMLRDLFFFWFWYRWFYNII